MNDLLEPVLGAERWPPMLGVVGFDGGYKSAVALAIPPEGLVAGEGEFGPGEGIGACCYNDGTCDNLTEFDCTSALGTYQGDGTDCASVSCTGVCCEPGCVDDTTPDGCALDGGTFQGFGTTCADDPPPCPEPTTGACCQSIGDNIICTPDLTEVVCTGGGGYYLGDGSDCTGSPCADAAIGACCYGCTNPCALTTHDGCPPNVNGGDGWLGSGISCTFGGFENICCPSLPDAVDCCIGGQFFGCLSPGPCSSYGGCDAPCAPDGSACSCGGMAFDIGNPIYDSFFRNN